ncbi:NTP transferase domain-containing protein [Calderihabitans maritimus]|uniref:Bifunctional IPC transferase and DIPP synthase n=1 Tax=Calderihabitans maritimus TaxID=1246530 RepID=A0A1Z5HRD5_9FIRM|nr:NTP transferase domain-containing protein [Calderihabitans maritimus]GAW92093.1 glucose-1-phosphate thymidylyl transferase [Calderihabitans maritimus]
MKALVIAAGEGSRLRVSGYHGVKPLYPLLGLSLIERVLLTLREAGIREVVLVIGFRGQEIKDYLGDGSRLGVKIQYIDNPSWSAGNGTSVLAAEKVLQGERSFLLTMADHIVSQEAVERLIKVRPREHEIYVGADFKLDRIADLEEATKILVSDGKITAIGKKLNEFQAVDCGLFHATPALFDALKEAQVQGNSSLSDGIMVMARQGQALVCDIGDTWWIDVDKPDDARLARKVLLMNLPSPRDGLVARYFNRKISVVLSSWLAWTRITPNQVSIFNAVLCFLSAILFATGHFLWAGLTAQIASIIDGIDGELARLKFLKSPFGELLDSVLDRYGDGLILMGMTAGAYLNGSHPLVLVLGSLALLGSPMSMLMKEKFHTATGRRYLPAQEGMWVNLLLANRDGRLLVVMLSGIIRLPVVGLAILAVTPHVLVLIRLKLMKRLLLKNSASLKV